MINLLGRGESQNYRSQISSSIKIPTQLKHKHIRSRLPQHAWQGTCGRLLAAGQRPRAGNSHGCGAGALAPSGALGLCENCGGDCSCCCCYAGLRNKFVACSANPQKVSPTPRKGGCTHAGEAGGAPWRRRGGYPAPNNSNGKHKWTYSKINKCTVFW